MKTLELNQMENVEAGSCEVAGGAYVATIIICAASGPFGWAALASLAVASIGLVDGCIMDA
jgi:hypothetical protein